MTGSKDTIDFYNAHGEPGRNLVAAVKSSIVPPVGAYISIRGETWWVVRITYALDHADDMATSMMRANVELRRADAANLEKI